MCEPGATHQLLVVIEKDVPQKLMSLFQVKRKYADCVRVLAAASYIMHEESGEGTAAFREMD